ncbi:MAG: tetratricopeptide repeat protein [Symploca sp. SIO1B1]|nr:tetratricopeptide repeat protein [Symploca sp. SIO1B1]
MDESRLQDYLNLINALQSCPSGEEAQVLSANQELVDAGLVQTMLRVANEHMALGKLHAANSLMNLAGQLMGAYGNMSLPTSPISTSSSVLQSESQLRLLLQVLQAVDESRGNPQVVYPLLQESLHLLDDNFVQVLKYWVTATLSEIEPSKAFPFALVIVNFSNLILDMIPLFPLSKRGIIMEIVIAIHETISSVSIRNKFPFEWAETQYNLGGTYCNRIRGEKADNLELAIDCYHQALSVHTRDAFPFEWAKTKNNLGVVYRDRIRGEKADNLELAIDCFQQALSIRTRKEFPLEWAKTKMNLGVVYRQRISQKKADNLEVVIDCFQQSLSVLTRKKFPFEWAIIQNDLGLAYCDRIRGEKADNLELAIQYFQQALSVYTRDKFPFEWATFQNNLGLAYRDRIRGEKADNIELAIDCYQQSLSIHTHNKFPFNWARSQMNLGSAYLDRIRGKKADNIEQAIIYCQQALSILTRNNSPFEWAMTQNNLAGSYRQRVRGDKAENLERAIEACQEALLVYTHEDFPFKWAEVQNNLGTVYSQRIRGQKEENLEQVIEACQRALLVYTHEDYPFEWARVKNNLGAVYSQRIRGQKEENLELSIEACQQALLVYTREDFPFKWAMTQNNLGAAYYNRIRGEKAENLEQSIEAYKSVLSVYTSETFPTDWAKAQNNLGVAYSKRVKGQKIENLKLTIEAYKSALSVYTREALPQDNAQTLFNLGIAYQTSNQLQLAHDTFESAIETLELLREEISSGDDIKQKLAEEWTGPYHRMVAVCLNMSRDTEALEYVERSKTRNLVENILSRDLHNLFLPEVSDKLQQLRDEIAVSQDEIQNHKADDPIALGQHLMQLRQRRNKLQNDNLPIGAGFRFEQFQAILDEHTAIIEWFITDDRILAFIIQPHPSQGQEVSVWQSTADDRQALDNWIIAYLNDYNQSKDNWRTQLTPRLEKLAKILHLDELIQQLPEECQRLIVIPHRWLHLFPLHALPISHNGKTVNLIDRFPNSVSYAPSCQLLLQAQERKRPNFTNLFAIQNPTNDLDYTDLEVQAIADYFNPVNILEKETATLTAINETNLKAIHCAHFSCHGYFNQRNARKSALILADAPLATAPTQTDTERYLKVREGETHDLSQCLTLDAILSLNLEQCRLVTLSACETGLIDSQNTSDEYIGLPSGFLIAGSPSVVSSLWRVNDLSTALLMIKFYQNLKSGSTVALALNQAQIWLRDATTAKLQAWTNSLNLDEDLTKQIKKKLRRRASHKQPFHSPHHWAAFCAIGQ